LKSPSMMNRFPIFLKKLCFGGLYRLTTAML
jgi:hypothetical protein